MTAPEDVRLFDIAGGPSARERGTTRRVWKARQQDLFTSSPAAVDGPAPELRDGLVPLAEDVPLLAVDGLPVECYPCRAGTHARCDVVVSSKSRDRGHSCGCQCRMVVATTTVLVSLFTSERFAPRSMAPDPTTVHHVRLALADRLPPAFELVDAELPQRDKNKRESYHLLTVDAVGIASVAQAVDMVASALASITAHAVTRCRYSEPEGVAGYRRVEVAR